MIKAKWRGIATTQKRINESRPITIINRLGQKSMSLPRIDNKKRWAGFPGNAGVARQIAKLIPKCYFYVEPFAGTAKVYQMLPKSKYKTAILNDKSKFVTKWLRKEFKDAVTTQYDFKTCFKNYDTEKTFFLIDHPWFKSYYLQRFSCFNKKSVKEYDEEIIEICKKLKGKFIITSRKENTTMRASPFKQKLIRSEYVVSGKYPKVLITTNLKLRK